MKRRAFLGTAALLGAAPIARAQKLLPAQDVGALVARITGGAVPERGGIEIELPPIAENGNSVPLRLRVESPMMAADRVTALHVFAERNPRPLVAAFHFGPGAAKAEVATRIRLAVEQKVTVLASLSGGRYRVVDRPVLVTAAACIDEGV